MSADLADKIVAALEVSGTHAPADIREAIKEGEMQAWQRGESLVVTHIAVWPRLKACEMFVAAGNLDEIWPLVEEEIEPWAKEMGCSRIVGRGRMGWAREIQKHGYETRWVVGVKEI